MSNSKQSNQTVNEQLENPRILGLAGGVLFALGLVAFFLAFVQDDTAAKVSMVLNMAFLLALGYPMLLYVRSLNKIAALEKRIQELEKRPKT